MAIVTAIGLPLWLYEAALGSSKGEVGWVVFPWVEDSRTAQRDVGDVSGGEVEVVFEGGGGQQGIDDGGRVAGEAFDLSTDIAPAKGDGVGDG